MFTLLKQIGVWLDRIFLVFFGSLKRASVSGVVLFILYIVLVPSQPDNAQLQENLAVTTNLVIQFEQEIRELREELQTEKQLRNIAEQTTSALAQQVSQQDSQLLDNKQQLAFLRQLIQERDTRDNYAIEFRSFDISPDFREDSYQIQAVLNRGGSDRELFNGKLELNLSLRSSDGRDFEYSPVITSGSLDIEFRYYTEIDLGFDIPPGAEVLNGQLILRNENNDIVASIILHDQVL